MSKNYFRLPITTASSGIHIEPFYRDHNLSKFKLSETLFNGVDLEISDLVYDNERSNYDLENFDNNEEALMDELRNSVLDDCLMYNYVYEPRIFDEEAAIMCHLIPFKIITDEYEDLELLSFGGCGMDMTYKLEAYQLLADGTYDPRSNFAEKGMAYFEYYYGKNSDVVKEINNLIKLSNKKIA